MQQTWGRKPVYREGEGGTVPIVAQMQRVLGVDLVIQDLVYRTTIYMLQMKKFTYQHFFME